MHARALYAAGAFSVQRQDCVLFIHTAPADLIETILAVV